MLTERLASPFPVLMKIKILLKDAEILRAGNAGLEVEIDVEPNHEMEDALGRMLLVARENRLPRATIHALDSTVRDLLIRSAIDEKIETGE